MRWEDPAALKVDVDEEDADKVYEAHRLLREAGIDVGTATHVSEGPKSVIEIRFDKQGGKGYAFVDRSEDVEHKTPDGGGENNH